MSVVLGLLAHVANGGSYSTIFSTIMRTTREASLSTPLEFADTSGKDPLPKYIAQATITFPNLRLKAEEMEEMEETEETVGIKGTRHVGADAADSASSQLLHGHNRD